MATDSRRGGDRGPHHSPQAAADDFLFHLYRGSDMLMQDRVMEAKEELEQALAQQPQDAKSQDLLAGVYFRMGFYPRAIEIWERLVAAYPRDATLRVNLALAFFKTGQGDTALHHVNEALRVQPDHARAWGYLGLIRWRLGQLEDAREAFLRGGQASMAKRMEEAIATASGQVPAVTDDAMAHADAEFAESHEDAARQIASPAPAVAASPAAPDERSAASEAAAPTDMNATVEAAAPAFVVDQRGRLHIASEGPLVLRPAALSALQSPGDQEPVQRRSGGETLDELLGGTLPFARVAGPLRAFSASWSSAGRAHAVSIEPGQVLFAVESALVGFSDALEYDSASLSLAGRRLELIQLHGETAGEAAFHVRGGVQSFVADGEAMVEVMPDSLLGWIGRLFPQVHAERDTLLLRGTGRVLVH